MSNIYDVILNFNELYYEVYEWKNSDNIKNIRKLPFVRVSDEAYLDLKNKKVKLDYNTLCNLKRSFSLFENDIDKITLIVTNGVCAMGIVIDKKGYVIARSAMLYEEEDEVIEESGNIKETKFKYDVIGDLINFNNRLEYEKKNVLYKFINSVSDKMILKYIYYDYYLVECDDIKIIKKDILNEINNCDYYDLFRLYNSVMLFSN